MVYLSGNPGGLWSSVCRVGLLRRPAAGSTGGAVVCLCRGDGGELPLIRRYSWLRDMGLIRGPLLLVDCGSGVARETRARLGRGMEICSLEELPARLEWERKRLG